MSRSFTVDKNFILTTEGINPYTKYMTNGDYGWYLIPYDGKKFDSALRKFMEDYYGNEIDHLSSLKELLIAQN